MDSDKIHDDPMDYEMDYEEQDEVNNHDAGASDGQAGPSSNTVPGPAGRSACDSDIDLDEQLQNLESSLRGLSLSKFASKLPAAAAELNKRHAQEAKDLPWGMPITILILASRVMKKRRFAYYVPQIQFHMSVDQSLIRLVTIGDVQVPLPPTSLMIVGSLDREDFEFRGLNGATVKTPEKHEKTMHSLFYREVQNLPDIRWVTRATKFHFDLSTYELLYFFPDHFQWRELARYLSVGGWSGADVAKMLNMQHRLAGSGLYSEETVEKAVVAAIGRFPDPVDLEAIQPAKWAPANGRLQPVLREPRGNPMLADLAIGCALDFWPKGTDRGEFTMAVEWAMMNQGLGIRLSGAATLASWCGFRAPPRGSGDVRACLDKHKALFDAYAEAVAERKSKKGPQPAKRWNIR